MMIEAGINSYITVDEALDFLKGSKLYEEFAGLPDEEKEYQLRQAVLRIERMPFSGRKKSVMQFLSFPREGQNEIPYQVKAAQALEAAAALDNEAESRLSMQAQGVSSVTVGQVSESYSGTGKMSNMQGLKSQEAFALLRRYLAGSFSIV